MSGTVTNPLVNTLPFRYLNEGSQNQGPVATLAAAKDSGWFQLAPGYFTLFADGVFGGATVKLQLSPDKKAAFDQWSASSRGFAVGARLGPCWARWIIVGGDGTTAIKCWLTGCD